MRCAALHAVAAVGAATGVAVTIAQPLLAADQPAFVAGTTPNQRPAGAPTLTTFERTDAWRARALTGVSEPIPPSLKFLNDQGEWFTPFTRAGMPGVYDIRGLHHRADTAAHGHAGAK